ncbi:DUF6455 family protein [Planktotalea sp.]|uniref:DUF6455 family protein n=1 Tax=Planktotalea sp. TaxID=2029877 RepID=UPI003D6B941B
MEPLPQTNAPQKLGSRIKHFWLAQRMAKRTGVDLARSFDAGDLTPNGWSSFVEECRGCAWAEGCQKFLNQPNTDLKPIPIRCENRETLGYLLGKQSD